ncbi:hypothetical protein [Ruminococcus sp.]|uniref:hypothetical protein n=1 Tax=Ruminococcus sp. TaxID=41978 RepID=UPI00258A8E1D|nr:hypothetical protein [Ruminococcus sp.]MCR5019451.1 hypothetical protein [Ruminococcus sp.]
MATITLRKSKFDGLGSVLDKLCSSFGNYDATMKELKRSAGGVDSSTCNLEDVIDDISNSEESKEEKVKRAKELKSKLDTFVKSAVQREKDAADEIVKKKKEFYKKYDYLKPDSEKSFWERMGDKISGAAKAIGKWMLDHLDVIIAAVIIIAAIVICVFCPATAIAIIGIVVSALSAVMGIADLVCMATHGGKDIATVLAESGHGTLAKIWKGTSTGLDVASMILPVGAGIKSAMTVGKKTFAQASKAMLKDTWKSIKGIPKGIKDGFAAFKTACKSDGFMKTLGKTAWGGFKSLTGLDDIAELKNIGKIKNNSLISLSGEHWDVDLDNMCMTPKSAKAQDALNSAGQKLGHNIDSIPLTTNSGLIDVDWDQISMKIDLPDGGGTITHLGKDQGFDMKNLGFGGVRGKDYDYAVEKFISTDYDRFGNSIRNEIYGNAGSRVNTTLNDVFGTNGVRYTSTSKKTGLFNSSGFTAHENYNMMYEHFVPTELHDIISHSGGTSHLVNEISKIRNIDHLFMRSGVSTLINGTQAVLSD